MDQGPLVEQQLEAGIRFLSEFHKYAPVQIAFWLKETDEGAWYLYVASDQITDENCDDGYGEVVRIMAMMRDPWLDMFQVKLIGADEPLAKAVTDLQRRYPSRTPARFFNKTFGYISAEEVCIYPSPIPAPVS
ncbi:MAG TPA: hypothetical protein VN688_30295 [Gemmataceae bacterium]|nr:hypothetical protein [Gemmataceae bacterium]